MNPKPPSWQEEIELGAAQTRNEMVLVCGECGHPMCQATFGYVRCVNADCYQCNALVYPPT